MIRVSLVLAAVGYASTLPAADRPNVVFVLMDDLRWDDLGCAGHPFAQTPHIDRLAREGARFTNAFSVTALCSPSRASFFSGLYPHAHGITDNTDRAAQSRALETFPMLLKRAGYETAFVGKWHMGVDGGPRPGFDHWVAVPGQGEYTDPEVNVNGRAVRETGYVTDIFTRHAVEFVRKPHAGPFLLCLSHKAVHPDVAQRADGSLAVTAAGSAGAFVPAERHRGLYPGAAVPRRPNVRDSLVGKPALHRKIPGLPPLGPDTGTPDDVVRNRLRMLAAADDGLGELLRALADTGRLDDTLIVFTSDHGYFYGEHGLSVERRLAYEEAIRIPLVVRYPRLVKAGGTPAATALSIDVLPTLVELAGAPAAKRQHGKSLVTALRGEVGETDRPFLIEHSSDNVFPRAAGLGYRAVRAVGKKYIRYTDLAGADEMYDLAADPYEMTNLAGDPSHAAAAQALRNEIDRLVRAAE